MSEKANSKLLTRSECCCTLGTAFGDPDMCKSCPARGSGQFTSVKFGLRGGPLDYFRGFGRKLLAFIAYSASLFRKFFMSETESDLNPTCYLALPPF